VILVRYSYKNVNVTVNNDQRGYYVDNYGPVENGKVIRMFGDLWANVLPLAPAAWARAHAAGLTGLDGSAPGFPTASALG
jgi:hypothetical protein